MSDTDTERWLAEVQARCDAATPKPWIHGPTDAAHSTAEDVCAVCPDEATDQTVAWRCSPEDARFISEARTDLPRALRIIARLREASDAHLDCHAKWRNWRLDMDACECSACRFARAALAYDGKE